MNYPNYQSSLTTTGIAVFCYFVIFKCEMGETFDQYIPSIIFLIMGILLVYALRIIYTYYKKWRSDQEFYPTNLELEEIGILDADPLSQHIDFNQFLKIVKVSANFAQNRV